MSTRPRRSCARVDDSILSPSTIFLWSDARLRQELTRRGLSRVGIREDLIDRLLDSINGIVSDKASEPSENASIASNEPSQQPSIDGGETVATPARLGGLLDSVQFVFDALRRLLPVELVPYSQSEPKLSDIPILENPSVIFVK
ncbi:unnamed protein product [Cylicostephanus goldi]|uniref:SAP domain-containing protein n=1 Tax=Cylicostephanus goldi TaxID=71465 RepID=A0A3P7QTS3_CYLGO|nr:unnamed protein product [Cylicostephanus goldi]